MSEIPEWAVATGHEIAALQWLHTFEKAGLAKTIARALSEAYTRGQMDMWQPIETAPKDGSRVLCWSKEWQAPESGCLYGTKWASNGLAADKGGWKYQPTHWCPLPPPPVIRSLPLQDEEGK